MDRHVRCAAARQEPRPLNEISTFEESSFDAKGDYTTYWTQLYARIGRVVAPTSPPLTP